MKKRIIAMLLLILVTVASFPVSAHADYDYYNYPSGSHRNNDGNWVIYVNGVTYNVTYGTVISQGNTSYSHPVDVAQMALNKINTVYSSANCYTGSPDGIFGSNTYNGVRNFQTFWNNYNASYYSYYIGVDGIVGNCTWACISTCST